MYNLKGRIYLKSKHSFFAYTARCIAEKRKAGQHSSADLYRTVSNWLTCFMGGRTVCFSEINSGFVSRFLQYLRMEGLRANTVFTYYSNLRAICNRARREGYGYFPLESTAPVASFVVPRREKTVSRALSSAEIHRVAALCSVPPFLERAVDYGLFSFLACGMPFVDLAYLTTQNICGEEIVYKRRKTGALIRVGITAGMRRLIDKYAGSHPLYLFPILPVGRKVTHESYKSILRRHNKALRQLGDRLGLPLRLTSYVFRHTWATEALRCHTPVSVISQALGHTSEKTTRFYLAALDQSVMNKMNLQIVGELDRLVVDQQQNPKVT